MSGDSVIVTTGVPLIPRCRPAPHSAQAGARRGCGLRVCGAKAEPVPPTWERGGRSLPRGALAFEAGLGPSCGLVTPCSESGALARPPPQPPRPWAWPGSPHGQPAGDAAASRLALLSRPEGEGLRRGVESGPRTWPPSAGPPRARPCVPVSAPMGPGARPRLLRGCALTWADRGRGGKWRSACGVSLQGPLPCPVLGPVASSRLSPACS